ncbi:hypothetical protein BGW36DRAFT_422592 [Talaromyces proteolyticus]|uniref:Uncharacterized protein n=1 Tax=Talaromyces proteolyticus TaxID=1131652 RepID=A0AAD4L552_9EURO|nr:uncharacterized protein BGW36DRAFT_422592 [Talaromyces proteolyticus]KAH8706073.1 hypothetical protein BGW36DRAFT_422592 [Talaromyces proteolyticus]
MDPYIEIDQPEGSKPLISLKLSALGSRAHAHKCPPANYGFTVNEKNPVSDEITLKEYISLTHSFNTDEENTRDPSPGTTANPGETGDQEVPTNRAIRIKLLSLSRAKIEDDTPAKKEEKKKEKLAQSTLQKDLKELFKSIGKSGDLGKLEDAAKLLGDLTSLKESYTTQARCVL